MYRGKRACHFNGTVAHQDAVVEQRLHDLLDEERVAFGFFDDQAPECGDTHTPALSLAREMSMSRNSGAGHLNWFQARLGTCGCVGRRFRKRGWNGSGE